MASQTSLIASWDLGQKEVSLFEEQHQVSFSEMINGQENRREEVQNRMSFSVTVNGQESLRERVFLHQFDFPQALELVNRLRLTIASNLADRMGTYAFLPALYSDRPAIVNGSPRMRLKVYLFGRVHSRWGTSEREVIGRWVVIDQTTGRSSRLNLTDSSGAAKEFLLWMPRESNGEYADYGKEYADYRKNFRVEVICERNGQIQAVALRHMSLFNNDVFLDERNWSITLVSTPGNVRSNPNPATQNEATGIVKRKYQSSEEKEDLDFGHAMLACEGVELMGGKPTQFLKYVHISTLRNGGDADRRNDQARQEVLEMSFRPDYVRGPTWLRPKSAIENMLRSVQEGMEQHRYVGFSHARDVAPAIATVARTVNISSALTLLGTSYICIAACFFAPTAAPQVAPIALRSTVEAILGLSAAFGVPTVLANQTNRVASEWERISSFYHCASWAEEKLKDVGVIIRLPVHSFVMSPPVRAQYLLRHPEAVSVIRGQN